MLLQAGEPFANDNVPAGLTADVVMAAPALDELGAFPPIAAPVRIAMLQGAQRRALPNRAVRRAPWPVSRARALLAEGVIAIFSDEHADDPAALAVALSRQGTAVVTRGNRGAWLYHHGARRSLPALPAHVVDPTGAGDAFAAAFALRLVETNDVLEACTFANAMGALVVGREGPAAMPARAEVCAYRRRGAA